METRLQLRREQLASSNNCSLWTCVMFSIIDAPNSMHDWSSLSVIDNVKGRDMQVQARTWCGLGDVRMRKAIYWGAETWRHVAVGKV
jgi:hypothetical protein